MTTNNPDATTYDVNGPVDQVSTAGVNALQSVASAVRDATNRWTEHYAFHTEHSYKAFTSAQSAIMETVKAVTDADANAKAALNNLDIYVEGCQHRANQAMAEGKAKAAEAIASGEAHLKLAEAFLSQDAMPPAPKGDRALIARSDARMMLDGASGDDLITAVKELASGDDELAGLVNDGKWLTRYMQSRGQRDSKMLDAVRTVARESAIEASRDSADAGRRRAAHAYRDLGKLRGALGGAKSMVHQLDRTF